MGCSLLEFAMDARYFAAWILNLSKEVKFCFHKMENEREGSSKALVKSYFVKAIV